MKWIIYTLNNPRTNEVRYVGWTSKGVNRRLNTHIQHAVSKPPTTHRTKWILSLLSIGLRPVIEIVESGTGDGWAEAERRWIAFFRKSGTKLVNATDGGEGTLGHSPSAEARAKSAAANRGKKRSPEHLKAWAEGSRRANLGRKLSPEHRANLAAALKGKPRDPELLRRLHEGMRRRYETVGVSQETRAKISEARKKRETTSETRAKMSATRSKRWAEASPEARAKRSEQLSEASRIRWVQYHAENKRLWVTASPETRAKRSEQLAEARRIRWEQYKKQKETQR